VSRQLIQENLFLRARWLMFEAEVMTGQKRQLF